LTAGYSFTALLCFACRNDEFQAENVFVYVPSFRPAVVAIADTPQPSACLFYLRPNRSLIQFPRDNQLQMEHSRDKRNRS
jgi:hypothetical protein